MNKTLESLTRRCFGPEIWLAGIAMHFAVLAGLVYAPTAQTGDAQRIMYFHVPSAWVSFLAFFVTFLASIAVLAKRSEWCDALATASAEIGVLFCTLALVTGSIWGKAAWNVWWVWDARLTTTFILWLIYAVYLVLRMSTVSPERSARFGAVFAIIGFINVPLVFLSIRLWRTQHPPAVVMGGGGGLDPRMLHALLFCVGAFTLLYFALLRGRLRVERLRKELL
jgi:heme exporter protein C